MKHTHAPARFCRSHGGNLDALIHTSAIVICSCTDQVPLNTACCRVQSLTAWGGIDALVHALESHVSILATEYTKGLSREAIILLFKHLPSAYQNGSRDMKVSMAW